ncbi:ABC transporter substrate-binding protein [Haloferax denitrificans]|uniref:ABC-type dipeptide/oligopeptide/nickel transport system, substrate binding protein n=1 Tax=Haloferax denitrificans ATCC 35960 TaxID=662478 RepID=M0JHL2_9EURY|nr:ABC transporter substrate-binding protein [Haloferax denitrificans]EMA08597.1 ABC-type dipeptide/oligopeptide/nickel transport system, substrate binding protein [Haloferax denitrificans ATCC 35960]
MPTGNIERRKLLKLIGSGATSVALAGCQGTQQTETTDGSSGSDSTATEQTSDDGSGGSGGSGGNDFHFIAGQVFGTLDPAEQVDYTQGLAAQNLYDELITVDAETLQPTAHIAESWDTEDEGQTWVFTLRDDVTFSDGTPLTADDVAYSLTRMLELQRGYSSFWLDYLDPSNITVRDERTVAFEFNQAYGPALATFVQFYIVNSAVVQENEQDGDYGNAYLQNNSAGSGAYVLDNWEQGNSIEASAYEDYWKGWSEDSFDTFRSTVITEESTIKTTMQQGEGDMTDQYMGTQAYAEMDSYSNVRVPEVPQLQLFHFPLNCQKAPTDDINVRKAIAYAFDYDSAVNDIIGGGGVAAGPVPREMAGHNGDLVPMEQDLDKAKEFLDKADYSVEEINEIGLEHVVVAGTELQRQMGLLNQAGLNELGIDLEINPLQWARLTDRATSAESTAHMTNIFHTAKMPSPDSHTYLMYHPSSFGSYISQSWYSTDEIAATLEEARKSTDLQSRLEKYEEAQALIVEGMPSVYIANPPYRIGINENVEGWQYRGVMSFDWDVHSMTRSGEGRAK